MITGPGNNKPGGTQSLATGLQERNSRIQGSYGAQQTGGAPKTAADASRQAEPVSLSSQARAMLKLEQDMRNHADVNESKVNEIRKQLDDGTYKLDPRSIARKMLDADQLF